MKIAQTTAGPVKCRMYDLYGRRAKTLREMTNSYARVEAGTEVEVQPYGGAGTVAIETDKCAHCGVRVRMTKIEIRDLYFEPFEHDPKRRRR